MLSRKSAFRLTLAVSGVLLLAVCTVAGSPADPLPSSSPDTTDPEYLPIPSEPPAAPGPAPAEPTASNVLGRGPTRSLFGNDRPTRAEALDKALKDYQTAVEAEMSDEALRAIEKAVLETLSKWAEDDATSFDKALETYKKVMELMPSPYARDDMERALLRARGYEMGTGPSESDHYGPAHPYSRSTGTSSLENYKPAKEFLDIEMATHHHDDAKLEQEAQMIAKQYLVADDEQRKSELETQLRELTERHFDLRQNRRESQVTRLEEELERVRESVQKRNQAREQIIQRRIAKLLRREDALGF